MRSYGAVTFAPPCCSPSTTAPPLPSPWIAPPCSLPFILFFTHKPPFQSRSKILSRTVECQIGTIVYISTWIHCNTHWQRRRGMSRCHWGRQHIGRVPAHPLKSRPMGEPARRAETRCCCYCAAEPCCVVQCCAVLCCVLFCLLLCVVLSLGWPLWLRVRISSHFMLYEHQTEAVNAFYRKRNSHFKAIKYIFLVCAPKNSTSRITCHGFCNLDFSLN